MVKKVMNPKLVLVQILQKFQDSKSKETKLQNQVALYILSNEELDTKMKKIKI